MPAMALCDRNGVYGAQRFSVAARQHNVRAIIGCELYVCKKDDHNTSRMAPDGDTYNHLLVLALLFYGLSAILHGNCLTPPIVRR